MINENHKNDVPYWSTMVMKEVKDPYKLHTIALFLKGRAKELENLEYEKELRK